MILMAVDHSSGFIARQHGTEYWNGAISVYTNSLAFLTRLVTHLCAPGFYFLLGAGMVWFQTSRLASGWTQAQVVRRMALRGLMVFLIAQFLENPILLVQGRLSPPLERFSKLTMAPPFDGSQAYLVIITLSCLGLVMMVGSLLLLLPPRGWLAVSIAGSIAVPLLLPASGKPESAWRAVLAAAGGADHAVVPYPLLPWLTVAAFGMFCGYLWQAHPAWRNRVGWLGLGMVVLACGLRYAGGWGNLVPARDASWIEFFNNVKYPPSCVFWTLSVGVDLLLLALLMRLPAFFKSPGSPLIVFGQTPMFFYVGHFYVLAAFAFGVFKTAGDFTMIYVMWVVVLAIMYPLCVWYGRFKLGKPPESIWRLF